MNPKTLLSSIYNSKFSTIYLFISLCIIMSIFFFTLNTYMKLLAFKQLEPSQSKVTLEQFHFFLKNTLKKEYQKRTTPQPQSDEESSLPTFHITLNPQDQAKLNANLPQSGKEFVDAYLSTNTIQKPKKISLRYRGDTNHHWFYPQKSLRIKLSKNDTYNMEKKFNLINPPSIISFRDIISYNLSRKLGLITPDFYPVRVFINAKYMGVYLYLSQVDESLLRKHKKMPGSIYYGDIGSPINKDGVYDLWFNKNYWVKKSSRNAEQKENKEDITLFINAINNYNDKEFSEFVETYINKKSLFTFIALDRLFGSHHHAYKHNHKLYFDPYKGKFEPISWDLRFWLPYKQKDLSLYPLQLRVTANPIYDAQIDKIVHKLLKQNIIKKIDKEYKNIITLISKDLQADPYKDNAIFIKRLFSIPISVPFTLNDLKKTQKQDINILKQREKYLLKEFQNCDISYTIKKQNKDTYKLSLTIKGNSPARIYFKNKTKVTTNPKIPITIYPKKTIQKLQTTFSKKEWGNKRVVNEKQTYTFIVKSTSTKQQLEDSIYFINTITNKKVKK